MARGRSELSGFADLNLRQPRNMFGSLIPSSPDSGVAFHLGLHLHKGLRRGQIVGSEVSIDRRRRLGTFHSLTCESANSLAPLLLRDQFAKIWLRLNFKPRPSILVAIWSYLRDWIKKSKRRLYLVLASLAVDLSVRGLEKESLQWCVL